MDAVIFETEEQALSESHNEAIAHGCSPDAETRYWYPVRRVLHNGETVWAMVVNEHYGGDDAVAVEEIN